MVSDPENKDNHDATLALTDNEVDSTKAPHNFWEGKQNQAAHFVLDLGCSAKIKEVHLRNSHTGSYQKK